MYSYFIRKYLTITASLPGTDKLHFPTLKFGSNEMNKLFFSNRNHVCLL